MYDRTEYLNDDIPDSVLLKYAILDLKKSRIKIGELESYIEELEFNLKKERIRFEEYSMKNRKHIKGLEGKNEKLNKQIFELNYKLSELKRTKYES